MTGHEIGSATSDPIENQAAKTESRQGPAVGSCFGFTVQSSLHFELTRRGPGTPLRVIETDGAAPQEVGDLVREWGSQPGETLTTRLYATPNVDHFWLEEVGWFEIDSRLPSIDIPRLPPNFGTASWRESILWGVPAAVCAVRRGLVSMHAASVEVDGVGLLLAGPGTFGKTTLSGAFLRAGHRLLSDDMACCRLSPEPVVFPGPTLLRLRRDVFDRLDFPGTNTVREFGRKVGIVLNESQRGGSEPVPLGGIVLLKKSSGEPALTRAANPEALRDLFVLSFKGVLDAGKSFEDLALLVSQVPVWYLERRLDFTDLPRTVDLLVHETL
jgi:hypothetical protein